MLPDDDAYRILKVVCNDRRCQNEMFISSLETAIECLQCGQKNERRKLRNVAEVTNTDENYSLDVYVRRMLLTSQLPKRGTEMVKVLGLSNYYCKLLSPLLTRYGMDRETGKARLLQDMNLGDIFDCSSFSDRAFRIEPDHIDIFGFGRDMTGSMHYLSETLQLIISSNGNEERLLPIHADGDGHCLVHAISRALVGRELFWHPLRCCLKKHFLNYLDRFKELFKDFIDTDEYESIIEECDPEFKPPEGELHGLRNIHIFGLANVLRRPIILLDSLECMKKSGDYSALFLPGFMEPNMCKGRDNTLNKPICIAWSSYSHNHYIPLVGIATMPLPVLPRSLLPKVWGMPQNQLYEYMDFDGNGNCTIGGSRVLSDIYIQRLVKAMEGQFFQLHHIHPAVVADVKLFLTSDNVLLNNDVTDDINKAGMIATDGRLFRCSTCKVVSELRLDYSWFQPGGIVYSILLKFHNIFEHGQTYETPINDNFRILCQYDSVNDYLTPTRNSCVMEKCTWCQSCDVEKLRVDGPAVVSHLESKSNSNMVVSKNDQNEPDLLVEEADQSKMLTLKIHYGDKDKEDVLPDFELVSREGLGEAVAHIASSFIQKHFPELGNSVWFQTYVAEEILKVIGKSTVNETYTEPEFADNLSEQELETVVEVKKETEGVQIVDSTQAQNTLQSNPSKCEPLSVKVVSPAGEQMNLIIDPNGISYDDLQEWIKSIFSIPILNQRIKIGFPPKELEVPLKTNNQVLPLVHGDRLMVENCPTQGGNLISKTPAIRNVARDISPNPVTIFKNQVYWNIAKLSPQLFRKGGTHFEEVSSARILYDLIHFKIESFPHKSFSYNAKSECIELCFKSLGHFEISQDLDSRIEQAQNGEIVNGCRRCPVMSLKTGHKDPMSNKTLKKSLPSTAQTSAKTRENPYRRKAPGVSILTSPESSDMDLS